MLRGGAQPSSFRAMKIRHGILLVIVAVAASCVSWKSYEFVPRQRGELPDPVRLQLTTGESVVLKEPRFEGDSVFVGLADGGIPTTVALGLVRSVEAQEDRSGALGATAIGVGFLVLILPIVGVALTGGGT